MKNFAGISLPLATASFVLVLPIGIIAGLMQVLMGFAVDVVDPSFMGLFFGLLYLGVGAVTLLTSAFLAGGIAEFALKVARGQTPEFGDVFAGGKYFGSMFVGWLGFFVATAIGFALCIVPGYLLQLGLWPFAFIIVDQRLGGVDALKKAWEMTKGHKMSIFIFMLLNIVVMFAGELACFVGMLLVSYPMIFLASAHMYVTLKGETPRLPGA